MASSSSPGADGTYTQGDFRWTPEEKAIARKAFQKALMRELKPIMEEARRMAAKFEKPSDLGELEDFLTRHRKGIDKKYDYRYSVLPQVFGTLIREGFLSEDELRGLKEDKLKYIRSWAKFRV